VGACAARHLLDRGYRQIGAIVPREAGILRLGPRPRLTSVALDVQASAQAIADRIHASVMAEAPLDAAPITIDEPRIAVRDST
jgi:DNA-binding LacI/PurR family transcriptional regulator